MNKLFNILDLINNESIRDVNYISLKEILLSNEYQKLCSPYSIPLGKDENGKLVIINLENIQNLLICGMSGTGKTSAIFTILISLILQNKSENFKIICIDSMRVEYFPFLNTQYSLFNAEESSYQKTFQVIDSIIQETNNRLKLKTKLPKVVCVIDDFANIQSDFELKKSNKFNDFINNIPLMNSVGIYVIMSTTIPTKNFITDKMKDIFSNRLAFAVLNSIDSNMIINQAGAEKLHTSNLGDCLLKTKENIKHLRCSYIRSQDMISILKHYNTSNFS